MLTTTFTWSRSAPTPSSDSANGTTSVVRTRCIMDVIGDSGSAPASLRYQ